MSLVGKLANSMVNVGKNAIFNAEKHSPELLVGGGVILGVGACFTACKATLKAEEVLDEIKTDIDTINKASEKAPEERYSKEDKAKDLTIAYVKGGVKFAKLYWKPLVLGTASIVCVLSGFNILRKRHLALIAAYGTLEKSYNALYSRVGKEFSKEAADRFANDIFNEKAEIIKKDEEGNVESKKQEKVDILHDGNVGPYSFVFGPDCPAWYDNSEYNLQYLIAQMRNANDKLIVKKDHILTASEVFSEMQMDKIPQDFYVVGWNLPKDYYRNAVEPYIQWDIKQIYKDYQDGNGPVKAFLVNMNCDGYVWNKIPA